MEVTDRALAELAAAASERFSWYRLRSDGTPPLVTRDLLDAHLYETATPAAETDVVFRTSGTASGQPRRIVWSHEELEANDALKRRLFRAHIGDLRRVVIDVGLGLAASSARRVFEEIGAECVELDYREPVEEHIAAMRRFGGDVLYSQPSLVDGLIRAGGIPAQGFSKLILVGEVVTRTWTRHVTRELGIASEDILDTYGCVETGLIAHRCTACMRFHFADAVIPETVPPSAIDPDWPDAALRADEAILVVSTRYRERMPIVRFVTYDVVRGFGTLACSGRERPGFDAILGRIGDEVKHGERVSLHDIERGILAAAPNIRYRVVTDLDRITVEVAEEDLPRERVPDLERSIVAASAPVAAMVNGELVRPLRVRRVPALPPPPGLAAKKSVIRR